MSMSDEGAVYTASDSMYHDRPLRVGDLLLVEDHGDTARILCRLLSLEGHRVEMAATLGRARELVRSRRFDLLIVDLQLPDGWGWDLMPLPEPNRDTPAIVLSAHGQTQDVERSERAGFLMHLTKPAELHVLFQGVRDAVQGKAGVDCPV